MTAEELKRQALREIRAVAFDDVAPAEEFGAATRQYALLHAQLLEMGLATWALTEAIPDKCAQAVTWLLCHPLSLTLSSDPEVIEKFQLVGSLGAERPSLAERNLRRVIAADYVAQPATSEYF